jgi:MOSC domain-containing protein YiiM
VFNPANTREMAFVGMYAAVLGEGRVAVGNPVRVLRR